MGCGKWVDDLGAKTPVADAARQVLAARLEIVRDCLSLAVNPGERDSEHVHQLRVGTRRARAAVDIFACCLPAKTSKQLRSHLREIRRSAGEARDWDVLLESALRSVREQRKRLSPGLDGLVGYIAAKREMAQIQLEETGKADAKAFDQLLAKTLAEIRQPRALRRLDLVGLSRPVLLNLLDDLDKAVLLDLEDYEHLHQVRILGKHLRYAMEIFADCFTAEFRERYYPVVEEMQEILGSANDSFAAHGRLETMLASVQSFAPGMWKRHRPGLEGLLRYHRDRLPAERRRFQNLWTRWDKSGEKSAFYAILKGG